MLSPCWPARSAKAPLASPAIFLVFFRANPRSRRITASPSLSSTSRFSKALRANCTSTGNDEAVSGRGNDYGGVRLEETVAVDSARKLRLDSWISSRVSGISRARVQFSIRSGLVTVNGRIVDKVFVLFLFLFFFLSVFMLLCFFLISIFQKLRLIIDLFEVCVQVSHNVKAGDEVNCTISELQPLRAEPENIPLDIVYEDDHVLVVNKPAHMVRSPPQDSFSLFNLF